MKVYLIRHGQSEGNISGRHNAWSQVSLTEKGKEAGEKICNKINRVLDEVGVGLTEEERIAFYRSLAIISDNLERVTSLYTVSAESAAGDVHG